MDCVWAVCVAVVRCCRYWGENGFFRIARGINNMQFESDCVYALFDVHHLEDVLDGRMGGSMFGVVEQRDRMLNMSKANPHVKDDKAGKRSHHRGGRRHRPRKGEVERVTRGHFGGEPVAHPDDPDHTLLEQRRALDAAVLLKQYSYTYHHHTQPEEDTGVEQGQREVDEHSKDRESHHHHQPKQRGRDERAARPTSNERDEDEPTASGSAITQQRPSQRDAYAVEVLVAEDSLSKEEEDEEASILEAVRSAYAHEQTRKRQVASSSSVSESKEEISANLANEHRERLQDEEQIAEAIHHALRHSASRAHVKQMVLHALQRLEEDSASEVERAKASGADARTAQAEKDRDVAIVEDEVGRSWRQESANATADDLDSVVNRVISKVKEGGRRIVEQVQNTEHQQDDQVERGGWQPLDAVIRAEAMGQGQQRPSSGVLFGVILGVVLGVIICGALAYLFIKHKERHEYQPL